MLYSGLWPCGADHVCRGPNEKGREGEEWDRNDEEKGGVSLMPKDTG